jgi:glycosyltransferase involved in cell wall biosynthesis
VCLVSFGTPGKAPVLEKSGIPELRIIYLNSKNSFDPALLFKLRKIIAEEKPDCIHTHISALSWAMWACLGLKIKKKIHTIHSMPQKELFRIYRFLHFIAFRFLGWTPVALSPGLAGMARKLYGCEVRHVCNGLLPEPVKEPRQILRNRYSLEIGFDPEDKIILNVANLWMAKNHAGLVCAFSKISPKHSASLILVGADRRGGAAERRLRAQIAALPGPISKRVFFLGERSDVPELMRLSDVFVLPAWHEGMPMSILEAMAYGVPIVATNVGGVPELLEDGCGILVPPKDEVALAAAIEEILSHSDRAARLKEAAFRKFSNHHHISKTAESYCRLFNEMSWRGVFTV